jgi:hypothetical protein
MIELARPRPFLLNGALSRNQVGRRLESVLERASGLQRRPMMSLSTSRPMVALCSLRITLTVRPRAW